LFRAVNWHIEPRPSARQELSLVFAKDLARCIVACLDHPAVTGKTYFVAAREVVTARSMAGEIATQMAVWKLPLPLPTAFLWPICLVQEALTRVTGKPNVLSLQKFAELRAPGWVCDPALFQNDTGRECTTTLTTGVAETLEWYRQHHWI
jgi:nucleoside-diphosphate-sugar epimerase